MSSDDSPDRERLAELADEQAALRRIATLVARGVPGADIFSAVAEEAHRLLRADLTGFSRFDPDGLWTVVAARGLASDVLAVGDRWRPGLVPGLAEVMSGRPARIDEFHPIGTALDDVVVAERLRGASSARSCSTGGPGA